MGPLLKSLEVISINIKQIFVLLSFAKHWRNLEYFFLIVSESYLWCKDIQVRHAFLLGPLIITENNLSNVMPVCTSFKLNRQESFPFKICLLKSAVLYQDIYVHTGTTSKTISKSVKVDHKKPNKKEWTKFKLTCCNWTQQDISVSTALIHHTVTR